MLIPPDIARLVAADIAHDRHGAARRRIRISLPSPLAAMSAVWRSRVARRRAAVAGC